MRNHAQAITACDLCVAVTATFRFFYVFAVLEHATRRILHVNVTARPTADWTLQQLREAIPSDHPYRFLIHDRDSIFSQALDQSIRHLGLKVLKTPVLIPQANVLCERLLGTLRRECLDFLIPLTEPHLRRLLHEWAAHYNTGHPHHYRRRCRPTGIGFRTISMWWLAPSWAACTMSTGWKRRRREDCPDTCVARQPHAMRRTPWLTIILHKRNSWWIN